ncbi:hypothetical protein NHQ30_011059 [Ciborinia camelliae]|nr:hypothetical protein NHQ30_011059 [Ciborinia camelliae]
MTALRVHANTGTILERVVPAEGVEIDGYHLPGGTIVGVNAWVIHRNNEIFGDDIDTFRPERWVEASDEKLSEMKRNLFSVSKMFPLHKTGGNIRLIFNSLEADPECALEEI